MTNQLEWAGRNAFWRPIETAPKDGTAILLFEPVEASVLAKGYKYGPRRGDMLCMGVGFWCQPDYKADYWADYYDCGLLMSEPTHWMPLPEPPTSSQPEAAQTHY